MEIYPLKGENFFYEMIDKLRIQRAAVLIIVQNRVKISIFDTTATFGVKDMHSNILHMWLFGLNAYRSENPKNEKIMCLVCFRKHPKAGTNNVLSKNEKGRQFFIAVFINLYSKPFLGVIRKRTAMAAFQADFY